LNEREIAGPAAYVRRECGPRAVKKVGQSARKKVDRLALELSLPGLVAVEDRSRASAEGAVVEESDLGIEEVLPPQVGWGRGGHGLLSYSIPNPHPPGDGGSVPLHP
jgi:hypothetical protein